ncbi:MAG: phosphoribosyltransferase family protein [Acutalibacteraceae bacterium]|jgi:adenine phosphoribosyltransferase
MENAYTMTIAGLERHLPLCPLNEHMKIAAFVIFGDVELTVAASSALLEKVPDFDVILTAEAKGIPLAYEMARQSGKPYYIARKYPKLYMPNVVAVDVRSITTDKDQTLYMDAAEMDIMRDKRVLIVDDVISTGESLKALETIVNKAGGIIAGQAAVLAEGDAAKRDDIVFLEPLPLFFND